MAVQVGTILNWMEQWAPLETAESWDNVGLMVGDRAQEVDRVLVALDVEPQVIQEAEQMGAGLILTHHPLLFHALRQVSAQSREGAMVLGLARRGISLAAYHTNLDAAQGGVNDALAAQLGLVAIQPLRGLPMARWGTVPPCSMEALVHRVQASLQAPNLREAGRHPASIDRVAVCGGAGGDALAAAAAEGAQVLVTGELKYHEAQQAAYLGLAVVEAGHFYSERPVLPAMASHLQMRAHAVQCKVEFICAQTVTCPYWVGMEPWMGRSKGVSECNSSNC
jgi:dinuclear metal center YbgI/SA1388 family protein